MKPTTTLAQEEATITEALILRGDLSALTAEQKVAYYRGYCERLGLDAFTKPFDILRLNGKDVLYLTRAGAQQLNKLHGVSHTIQSRELMQEPGIFQVTARAILPDGRHTESMSAVSVGNLKGEAYCNALMKAETKAKRRATLDLLGLGILSEEEAISLGQPAPQIEPQLVIAEEVVADSPTDPVEALKATIGRCETLAQLNALYLRNQPTIEANGLRALFTAKKSDITNK